MSVVSTTTDIGRKGMPVEGFEPSTPHGDLFLRQARIPFRHAGLGSSFSVIRDPVSHRNKCQKHETKRVLRILQLRGLVNTLDFPRVSHKAVSNIIPTIFSAGAIVNYD